MSSGTSKTRDKEMSAMTHNLKEQRVLEKSMQTLKLEETYSLKLLELDNRIIKTRHKRLKEKVSMIKSHLPPEDINKFRELDTQGKMKPLCGSMSLSSAIKIAAASRRLNLNSSSSNRRGSSRREARSVLPTITVQDEDSTAHAHTASATPTTKPPLTNLRRSNSITGVFMDAPDKVPKTRPDSASVVTHLLSNNTGRQRRQAFQEHPEFAIVAEANSPQMTNGNEKESLLPENLGVERQDTVVSTRTVSARPRSHSLFSSHVATEKDAREENVLTPRKDNQRRMSHVSISSIDSNLGENPAEERRRELLEGESVRAEILAQRTKLFLQEVDEYLEQHPPLQTSHIAFEQFPPVAAGSDAGEEDGEAGFANHPLRFYRHLHRPGAFDSTPTAMPDDQYRQKLLTLWKDMNKCRYLRLPDDKLDLSGINTLVKDQLKLFQTLRNQEI